MSNRLVLGFDARVTPSSLRDIWSTAECQTSLVRPGVIVPLSVDYLVWPSVLPIDATDWKGPVQDLWDTPQRLFATLERQPPKETFWPIAVALLRDRLSDKEASDWKERVGKVTPKRVSRRWQSLGFDVADRFLTSGMVRFHSKENIASIHREWATHVNDVHLFSDQRLAFDFATYCDQVGPHHAPFFVYEILLIQQPEES